MGEFIRQEIDIFLEASFSGMMIAAAYDILRILRRIIRHGSFLVNIQDFFFWVIAGIVVFSMIFECNQGVVRGYIFVALLIGGYLYHKSVSSFLVSFISRILNILITFLLKKPFKWVKMMMIKMIKILSFPFKKAVIQIKNKTKNNRGNYEKKRKYHDKKKKEGQTGNIRN